MIGQMLTSTIYILSFGSSLKCLHPLNSVRLCLVEVLYILLLYGQKDGRKAQIF